MSASGGVMLTLLSNRLRLPFPLSPSVVALFRVGSHSHGTHIPPDDPNGIDDTDYMLIVAPPRRSVYGLRPFEHTTFKEDTLDVVVYSWGKFVRLLLKSNPNVLGTLWLDPSDVDVTSPAFELLVSQREAFMSKFIHVTFSGYAHSQLKKMTHFAHKGYMGEKRKRLVEQFGYDVKNAAHLIRLLRMGAESLRDGQMVVRRPDADELKEIKRGAWTLERVQSEAEAMFSRLHSDFGHSVLPEFPDEKAAEAVLLRGYEMMWEVNDPALRAK